MTSESLNMYGDLNVDEDIMKLGDSGRISLSDITAATLGNLADASSWDSPFLTGESELTSDNVNSIMDRLSGCENTTGGSIESVMPESTETGSSVLRPWENSSRSNVSSNCNISIPFHRLNTLDLVFKLVNQNAHICKVKPLVPK